MSEVYTTKENYEELDNEIQSLSNLYYWLKDVENNQYLKFNDEYLNDICYDFLLANRIYILHTKHLPKVIFVYQ